MQVFINNNARFCYQSKEKVLSSNTFERMKIPTKKDKNGKPYWWRFKILENLIVDDDLRFWKTLSSDESGSKSDNDKDNDESNE